VHKHDFETEAAAVADSAVAAAVVDSIVVAVTVAFVLVVRA
jgi:hypothetical protein